jgi:hypothetical protein
MVIGLVNFLTTLPVEWPPELSQPTLSPAFKSFAILISLA